MRLAALDLTGVFCATAAVSLALKGATAWRVARVTLLGVALGMAIGVAGPARAIDCSPGQADLDLDGVVDPCDNCPPSLCGEPLDCANPAVIGFDPSTMTTTGGQLDSDGDGLGDICDVDLPPWEVSAGNTQVSCPACPLECAGLGCPGSRAADFSAGVATLTGLERACDTTADGFADGDISTGCHQECDLDGDQATLEWCRKLDLTVYYPTSPDVEPAGGASLPCGFIDQASCEEAGCAWTQQFAPAYLTPAADFRCLSLDAQVNAALTIQALLQPLPVVVLSHGLVGANTDYSSIAADLARQGYVVISISLPGLQWFETFFLGEGELFQAFKGLDANPYCNSDAADVLHEEPWPWELQHVPGFSTREDCTSNYCVWDDVTGCDGSASDPAQRREVIRFALERELAHDVSDVLTYFFGGQLYDSSGQQTQTVMGFNETGEWPFSGWNQFGASGLPSLDPARISFMGHSLGAAVGLFLTSKAAYDEYSPAPTGPNWDTQRNREPRISSVILLSPPVDATNLPRVMLPLSVPTLLMGGALEGGENGVPFSDHANGERSCPFTQSSGTRAEDPLCSLQGMYDAAQSDAPELEAQGLVAEDADPPRFLLGLDTGGHLSYVDRYVQTFSIKCPTNPTLPCNCNGTAGLPFFGAAECGQLSGDHALAQERIGANLSSFFGAFAAMNPGTWQVVSGAQSNADLQADWDRDAPACGFSPLLGDGLLDSLDPEPLVCNLPDGGLRVPVDVKPGSCPNAYNRKSNGVLPVAVVGTEEFDVLQVDLSTVEICSVDPESGELIGCIAPHEGPPGPHSTIEDVTTPYGGSQVCGCEALGPDGIPDLALKFKTAALVEALQLDLLPPGALPELVVRGSLLDGTPFEGSDCVRLVPPGTRIERIQVQANASNAWIDVSPLDETLDGGGFSAFERSYPQTTEVTLTAPPMHAGRAFRGWRVDGGPLITDGTVSLVVDAEHSLEPVYQAAGGCGLGVELALILPGLMWLHSRRRRLH